jgi:UDPglucose 6-dehydrogenase
MGTLHDSVAVVGLGKLGLPWACILASKGRKVRGIDCSIDVVRRIRRRQDLGPEPRVAEMLRDFGENLEAATDYGAIAGTSAAFVVVNTPNVMGKFSLQYVLPAVREIARRVTELAVPKYTIVLVSTVMPEDCANRVWPAIEEASGSRGGEGIELVYCPEFVALGHVVDNMLNPEFVVVGSRSPRIAKTISEFYRGVVDNRPCIHCTTLVNAEITKLALNVAVSFKITCANLLAAICQQIPGADVDEVTRAVGSDSRIGAKFFRGGLGYAGPCFPRDVQSIRTLCDELRVSNGIAVSVEAFNQAIPVGVLQVVKEAAPTSGRVGVLGLTYRAGSGIDRDSQAGDIVRGLRAAGVPVAVYDPRMRREESSFGNMEDVAWCDTLEECLSIVGKVVIATEDEEFQRMDPRLFQGKTIIDCWRTIPSGHFSDSEVCYIPLGRGRPRRDETPLPEAPA